MNDLDYGKRDKRGNWTPSDQPDVAPFWSAQWRKMPRYLFDFVWPWNAFHVATACLYWVFVIPDAEVMNALSWGWTLWLLSVNAAGICLMYGGMELFYYARRKQDNRFKYNPKFPAENPSEVFWFKRQNLDNFLRSFFIGIPIWTATEILMLWCFANDLHVFAWLDWENNWAWLVASMFLAPAVHEVNFFCIHRLLHVPFLYKWVHAIHHNSNNPSPWSSLSMHPFEHLLFFGEVFWFLIIPSNPIVVLFSSHLCGYGAVNGHIGFHKLELSDEKAIDSHSYLHYLHHKYFEVNYGADGLVPFDKWFGYWHDGSKESDERMKARFRKKRQRLQAR